MQHTNSTEITPLLEKDQKPLITAKDNKESTLEAIPNELLYFIGGKLNDKDLLTLTHLNKTLRTRTSELKFHNSLARHGSPKLLQKIIKLQNDVEIERQQAKKLAKVGKAFLLYGSFMGLAEIEGTLLTILFGTFSSLSTGTQLSILAAGGAACGATACVSATGAASFYGLSFFAKNNADQKEEALKNSPVPSTQLMRK